MTNVVFGDRGQRVRHGAVDFTGQKHGVNVRVFFKQSEALEWLRSLADYFLEGGVCVH